MPLQRHEHSGQGHGALAIAILTQAVEDYRSLEDRGVIRPDGSVITDAEWPQAINANGYSVNVPIIGYRQPYEVNELIMWLSTDLGRITAAEILDYAGEGVDQEMMCEELGLRMEVGSCR